MTVPWTCLLAVLLTPMALFADDGGRIDRWYSVLLEGQPVGWMHTRVQTSNQPPHAPPSIITATTLKIVVRRGQTNMQLSASSWFLETVNGRPLIARSRQKLGQMQISQVMCFRGDTVEWTRRQGDTYERRVVPYPRVPDHVSHPQSARGWLTPTAIQRLLAKRLAEGTRQISYWSLDPLVGVDPIETRIQVRGLENVPVLGKVVPAVACDSTMSNVPGITTREYIDADGWMVKSVLAVIPGMKLTVVEADKRLATAKVQPPELLASTLIRPNRPISQPRQLQSAVYELTFAAGNKQSVRPGPLTSGFQHAERHTDTRWRVVVDLSHPVGDDATEPSEAYLEATAMLNGQDPKIRQLLHESLVTGPLDPTPAQRAETIRRFVHQYIQAKDLSVGLATASEVARTRQGDCTEHAVLLAAMLRAAHIPSRTVSGLIYVDRFLDRTGVFGYHMWTQAWLGDKTTDRGRWVDLDATLGMRPFDAGHIALATSDMHDGSMANDLMVLVPVMGRLKINVINTTTISTPTQR